MFGSFELYNASLYVIALPLPTSLLPLSSHLSPTLLPPLFAAGRPSSLTLCLYVVIAVTVITVTVVLLVIFLCIRRNMNTKRRRRMRVKHSSGLLPLVAEAMINNETIEKTYRHPTSSLCTALTPHPLSPHGEPHTTEGKIFALFTANPNPNSPMASDREERKNRRSSDDETEEPSKRRKHRHHVI